MCRPLSHFYFIFQKIKIKNNRTCARTRSKILFIPLKLLTSLPFPTFSILTTVKLSLFSGDVMAATESNLDEFLNLDYELRYPSLADTEAFMTGVCSAAFQTLLPVTPLSLSLISFSISILKLKGIFRHVIKVTG